MGDTRVGIGYDVHAFAEGRRLVLGGVDLPCPRGLAGHSDADVLVHAVMDAVLGALRADDIGQHFPDTDSAYDGVSSLVLLERVADMVREQGFSLVDCDTVLVLEEPKIAAYRDDMRANIAESLGIDRERVGVKATTTEGLGATGRGEGVAAYALVLLERVGSA